MGEGQERERRGKGGADRQEIQALGLLGQFFDFFKHSHQSTPLTSFCYSIRSFPVSRDSSLPAFVSATSLPRKHLLALVQPNSPNLT